MMSGEVDYGEFFYGQNAGHGGKSDLLFKASDASDLIHPMTAHILYGAFVILVTIVLTNLLIGLAVDDIKVMENHKMIRIKPLTELKCLISDFNAKFRVYKNNKRSGQYFLCRISNFLEPVTRNRPRKAITKVCFLGKTPGR